jgi:hypothetical protein
MERRTYPRIDTRLRCELQHAHRVYEAVTLNLSRTGGLIEVKGVAAELSPGQHVVLRVAMPERPLFEPKCMECSGVVCRTNVGGSASAVALSFQAVRFQSAEKMVKRGASEDGSRSSSHVQ